MTLVKITPILTMIWLTFLMERCRSTGFEICRRVHTLCNVYDSTHKCIRVHTYVDKQFAVKTCGRMAVNPTGTGWSWVVRFVLQPLRNREAISCSILGRRLYWLQREDYLSLHRIELYSASVNPVILLTVLLYIRVRAHTRTNIGT